MTKVFVLISLSIISITSCGKSANSDSTHAELVQAPLPGYVCFAIKNNAGETVGGNCIKE